LIIELLSYLTATAACNVPGKCIGSYIDKVPSSSFDDCLKKCESSEGLDKDGDGHRESYCTWVSYDPDTNMCRLLNGCPDIEEESCDNCVSANVRCSLPGMYVLTNIK